MITSANEKSALSDARNALTNYEAHIIDGGSYYSDAVFIVGKAKKQYLFGYIASVGELYGSVDNPYTTESDAIAMLSELIAAGSVEACEDQAQIDITTQISGLPDNVFVFSGYKILSFVTDLTLDKESLDVGVGNTENLTAVVAPAAKISYTSSDNAVATIDENGVITGISEGEATITVSCGNISKTCVVNVIGYIDFYGTIEQLKQYFEGTGTTTTYLRLMNDVESQDATLFPLVVPSGKHMRLDLNGYSITFAQMQGDTNAIPKCLILNTGGEFIIENKTSDKICELNFSSDGLVKATASDAHYSTINNESGELYIYSSNLLMVCSVSAINNSVNVQVMNSDRLEVIGVDNWNSYYDEVTALPGQNFLCNTHTGHVSISNTCLGGRIENEGVIEAIEGCLFESNGTGIINRGTLIKLTNCKFSSSPNIVSNAPAVALKSEGIIGDIIRCEFVAKENGVACQIDSGMVNRISGCTFSGIDDALVFSENATLTNKLTDGTYSHAVAEKLIADGFACTQNGDGMYVIGK